MAINRRGLLERLGRAVTALFMPVSAMASAGKGLVTYSPAAVHAAIRHAQSRAVAARYESQQPVATA